MWKEITSKDGAGIDKFLALQTTVSSAYKDYTPERILNLFKNKKLLRMFIYDDGIYQINLITCLMDGDTMKIISGGMKNPDKVGLAPQVTADKVLSLLPEYGVKKIFVTFPEKESNSKFYAQAFTLATTGKTSGIVDKSATDQTAKLITFI